MSDDRTPTEFGWFVLRRMADCDPPLNQTELARRTGVSQSTVSRYIYSPGRPDTAKLDKLAEALNVDYGELLAAAGHGRPAEQVTVTPPHRLARELDAFLADNSPLSQADRDALETVLDRLFDPYRRLMGRRRHSHSA